MPRPKPKSVKSVSSPLARQPSQERSRVRFNALLDATRDLVAEQDFADFGVYEIARRAGVPPTSAYHFIPTRESALLALGERYLLELNAYLAQPVEHAKIQNWPHLISLRFDRCVTFFNANIAFRKLFLSGAIISGLRKIDVEQVNRAASLSYKWLDEFFMMPYLPLHQFKFSTLIALYDGIWMASCARHGFITEEFANEARVAGLAYCHTFLPDVLPMRAPSATKRAM